MSLVNDKSPTTQWKEIICSHLSDFIAGWVPFYWLSKVFFLVWCMAPFESNGSKFIYAKLVNVVLLNTTYS